MCPQSTLATRKWSSLYCKAGHYRTSANTYSRPDAVGIYCMDCHRAYVKTHPREKLRQPQVNKPCSFCGSRFWTARTQQRFCSDGCQREDQLIRNRRVSPAGPVVAKHAVGAASELVVAADLLRRGYQVFRAVSGSSRTDLVAYKDDSDRPLKIEVKRGSVVQAGYVRYSKNTPVGRYDVLAVATDSAVLYEPDLP